MSKPAVLCDDCGYLITDGNPDRKTDCYASDYIAELKQQLDELRAAYEAAAIKHLGVSEDGEWVSVPRWFLDTIATALQEKGE